MTQQVKILSKKLTSEILKSLKDKADDNPMAGSPLEVLFHLDIMKKETDKFKGFLNFHKEKYGITDEDIEQISSIGYSTAYSILFENEDNKKDDLSGENLKTKNTPSENPNKQKLVEQLENIIFKSLKNISDDIPATDLEEFSVLDIINMSCDTFRKFHKELPDTTKFKVSNKELDDIITLGRNNVIEEVLKNEETEDLSSPIKEDKDDLPFSSNDDNEDWSSPIDDDLPY